MKRVFFIAALIAVLTIGLFALTGCEDKKEETAEVPIIGGWESIFTNEQFGLDSDTLDIFNDAKEKYSDLVLEPVALLGSQVVAGTNRMYLAKGYPAGEEDSMSYKMIIVYTDLEGNSSFIATENFEYSQYTNTNIESNDEVLPGGWSVTLPSSGAELGEEIQTIYNNATSTLTGVTYYPIALLGKQLVSGTNYAILCFGASSFGEQVTGTVNLITIYKDLNGESKVISQAYINLADFNP